MTHPIAPPIPLKKKLPAPPVRHYPTQLRVFPAASVFLPHSRKIDRETEEETEEETERDRERQERPRATERDRKDSERYKGETESD